MRDNDVVESRSVTGIPPATPLREVASGTATLATQITSMALTVVAQRARANPGARVRESPEALRCEQPGPTSLKPLREVADVMAVGVPRFNGKFATAKTNPDRRMCIGTGQGGAFQRSCAPARYPRLRTDRGGDWSTASLARRSGHRHPQELMHPSLHSHTTDPSRLSPRTPPIPVIQSRHAQITAGCRVDCVRDSLRSHARGGGTDAAVLVG